MVNGCLYAWAANTGTGEVSAKETALGLWFADLPTTVLLAGAEIEFILNCEEKPDGEQRCVVIEAGTSNTLLDLVRIILPA